MTLRFTLLCLLGSLVASCRSAPEEATPTPAPRAEPAPKPTGVVEPDKTMPSYDLRGALVPSEQFVVGIPLPEGLELFHEDELMHVYRIQAPIRKVLAYFGPMLITGRVERQGQGAVYRAASVRGSEVNPTKVEVSILDIGSGLTRVAITELPPPPAYPPTEDEVILQVRQEYERLD